LRAILDKEFEYVDNELSMVGFKNVVKRWLKIKRIQLRHVIWQGRRIAQLILNLLTRKG
jgi:hypothetical protein